MRIIFVLVSLNDLDVFASDIGNEYLNAPCREKICMEAGPEFGSQQGYVMLIVIVLYGLKSSGDYWRVVLA